MSNWKQLGSDDQGDAGQPGSLYTDFQVTILRSGERYRAEIREAWGSNQGYLEEHGSNEARAVAGDLRELRAEALSVISDSFDESVQERLCRALHNAIADAKEAGADESEVA